MTDHLCVILPAIGYSVVGFLLDPATDTNPTPRETAWRCVTIARCESGFSDFTYLKRGSLISYPACIGPSSAHVFRNLTAKTLVRNLV
jgi:hypothetical protein